MGLLANIIIGCVVGMVFYGIYNFFKERTTPTHKNENTGFSMGVFFSSVTSWLLTVLAIIGIMVVAIVLMKACGVK